MFDKQFKARGVAEYGYHGMLKGKLNVITGVSFMQRVMMKMIPFLPKKMALKQIRQMQEIK